jgi:GTP-binding protein
MFRDECVIEVRAGKGGDGVVSFYREKFVQMGGPDGGDGGRGGSVVLVTDEHVNSLLEVGRRRKYAAGDGQPGGARNKAGRDAEDRVLQVPVGTQVFDHEHGNLLRDLLHAGDSVVIAAGGDGGLGNARFANSVRQAPRTATKGRPGEARVVRLELKLFAEVGLVGLPNAGKSTLLSKVTAATPKIADYPFTTLSPNVGIARVGVYDQMLIADLPGLIEGAADGHGLGHRFLKHVERCRVLLQLVDVSSAATLEPFEAWRVVDAELARSNPELHLKSRLVVASKCEDEESAARADELAEKLRPLQSGGCDTSRVLRISSATGAGLPDLLARAHELARRPAEGLKDAASPGR